MYFSFSFASLFPAVAGNTIGKLIDDNVLRIWKCGTCGHVWRAA